VPKTAALGRKKTSWGKKVWAAKLGEKTDSFSKALKRIRFVFCKHKPTGYDLNSLKPKGIFFSGTKNIVGLVVAGWWDPHFFMGRPDLGGQTSRGGPEVFHGFFDYLGIRRGIALRGARRRHKECEFLGVGGSGG